jgi:hypothetical protein
VVHPALLAARRRARGPLRAKPAARLRGGAAGVGGGAAGVGGGAAGVGSGAAGVGGGAARVSASRVGWAVPVILTFAAG